MADKTLFVGKGSFLVVSASSVRDNVPPSKEQPHAPVPSTRGHVGQEEQVNASQESETADSTARVPELAAPEAVCGDRSLKMSGLQRRPNEDVEPPPAPMPVYNVAVHAAAAGSGSSPGVELKAPGVSTTENQSICAAAFAPRTGSQNGPAAAERPRAVAEEDTAPVVAFDADSPLHCPALPPGVANLRWKVPAGMPAFTCLSNHVMSALFAVPALDGIDLSTLPLCEWPESHFTTLKGADVSRLLDAEARGSDVRVGVSTVPGGGRGVFATRAIKAGERLMPFTGQIVYESLEVEASSTVLAVQGSRYGTSKFSSTARNWAKTAVEVKVRGSAWRDAARTECVLKSRRTKATKRCGQHCLCTRSVWIVPAPFCVAGVVNDCRRVRGGKGVVKPSTTTSRPNAVLEQRCDPAVTCCDLTQAGFIHVLVTADIKEGEEVLLDYGGVYAYYEE